MFVPNRELGDFLLDSRLLSRAQVADFLAMADEEGTGLYELILKSAAVDEDELRRAAAHVLGVPFRPVAHEDIIPEVLMLVPEPLARTHSLAAFARAGTAIDVLLLDLSSLGALGFLQKEQGLSLVPHLTDRASIKRTLLLQQKHLKEHYAEKLKNTEGAFAIDALLSHAELSRASEVHLEPRASEVGDLRVRYRVGAVLYEAMSLPRQAAHISSKLKELAHLSFTLPVPQEGRFKTTLKNGESLRVRVATLPGYSGEKITLHLAHESAGKKGFTLGTLGLHGEGLELVHEQLAKQTGLILIAAPQGGGKTTTLYTLLDTIASPTVSIVSIEEKIEVPIAQITQVQIRRDLGATYASTLRAALRQNPDIIMVGEIQDEETASLAVGAASRGKLVIAGIDANSAAGALGKIVSLGIPPALLASTLSLVIGQRVVRRVCPHCKEEYTLSRAEAAPLERDANFGRVLAALKDEGVVDQNKQWKEVLFTRGTGCSKCEGGYKGTIGLQEVLYKGETPLSIVEDGLFKAAQGLTSIEEVSRVAEELNRQVNH